MNEQIDALREAFNALADEVRAHDAWAKSYNVTVEARNKKVYETGEEWQRAQREAVDAFAALFEKLLDKIEAILPAHLERNREIDVLLTELATNQGKQYNALSARLDKLSAGQRKKRQ